MSYEVDDKGSTNIELSKIEEAIKETLKLHGLKGVLAKEENLKDTQWDTVKFCMDKSDYAIAVYGSIDPAKHSQNIPMEHGYMIAKNKDILILKQTDTQLPSNISNHLFKEFNPKQLGKSIETSIKKWLVGRRELITKTMTNEKDRTSSIIEELDRFLDNTGGTSNMPICRHAAILSSFAISDSEKTKDAKMLPLIIEERKKFESIVAKGFIVKLIICPEIYTWMIKCKIRDPEEAEKKILCRYDQLILFLKKNLETRNLRIVCAPLLERFFRLGGDFLVILDDNIMFRGRKSEGRSGFRHTYLTYDDKQIKPEIEIFDKSFNKWAYPKADMQQSEPPEKKLSSINTKYKIIEKLEEERDKIRKFLQTNTDENIGKDPEFCI